MSFDVSTWGEATASGAPMPSARVTVRVMREAVEESLMSFTRVKLEEILPDDLQLPPPADPLEDYPTKRTLIGAFISGRSLPGLAELAERIIETLGPDPTLEGLVTRYRDGGGGVAGPVKNLILAADGPKPELVLRDAINNQIEIVANAEHCLVYDRPVAADGLTFAALVAWWRERQELAGDLDEQSVGRHLHKRLVASLVNNPVERELYYAYNRRYLTLGFDIAALIPQVYLHYDPYTARSRGRSGSPLPRQRMDFLLLLSERRRVVLEVDGAQHYSADGRADPTHYAAMVSADRQLRLAGYEVYRFGGKELDGSEPSRRMLTEFFDELTRPR